MGWAARMKLLGLLGESEIASFTGGKASPLGKMSLEEIQLWTLDGPFLVNLDVRGQQFCRLSLSLSLFLLGVSMDSIPFS